MRQLQKYLKIYLRFLRFNFIYSMTYRVSFLLEFSVELLYSIGTIVFFQMIYGNIHTLAGWSYYQIMFLIGVDIVVTELYVGIVFALNTNNLPEAIKDGTIDSVLLKPLNSQFMLTIARTYIPSLITMIPGFYLIYQAILHLHLSFNLINTVSALAIFICGLIIAYSIITICASLAFYFTNARLFPRIGMDMLIFFDAQPHQIYFQNMILHIIFLFIIPVVFIGSIPVWTLTKGLELGYLLLAITLASLFFILTRVIWGKMIRYYSSASS